LIQHFETIIMEQMTLDGKNFDTEFDSIRNNAAPQSKPYEIADICFGRSNMSGME
jgi:hypothetical protein